MPSSAARVRRGSVHGQQCDILGDFVAGSIWLLLQQRWFTERLFAPSGRGIQRSDVRFSVVPTHPELVDTFRSVSHRSSSDKVSTGRGGKRLSPRTAARWLAEGITKAGLQAAATGTGTKGSASHSLPTVTLNLPGAGAGHLGGHQRSSVNVNGRLPFKVCHSGSTGNRNDQPNSLPVWFRDERHLPPSQNYVG